MDAQTLALLLLVIRILAVILLSATVYKQINQMRYTETIYPGVRVSIFIATVILLVGQFIPITLDSVVAYGSSYEGRSLQPEALSVSYSLNNAIKDVVIGSLLAFQHYRPRRNK